MTRAVGRCFVVAASLTWAAGLVAVGAVTSTPAVAQTCLPSPTVLFTEVARVAGTTSQLWADIQRVEQQDGALGTTGSGQVMQDILTVVAHDSYQWDCNGNKLTWAGPAGSSPPPSVPVTAPQTSPATTPGVATPDAASTSTTPPDAGATTNDTSSSAVAVGQTGSANGSSGTKVPMAPLVGLLVLSVALLVFVVYRLMTRD